MENKLSLSQQIVKLDPLGNLFFMPAVICLLMALEWGGTTYAWHDWRIILCLVFSGVLFSCFVAVQIWRQESATVPPRIFVQRSILGAFWFSLSLGSRMLVMVYYVGLSRDTSHSFKLTFSQLPIWFQAIKSVSAERSGLMNLPMLLCVTIGAIGSGIVTRFVGYYTPFAILSSVIMAIGAGLITTLKTNSDHSYWMGYQAVLGLGIGLGMQQPALAAQTVLAERDVPTGTSLMFFSQTLGGAVFISIAQNVFTNKLAEGVATVPGLNPHLLVNIGATQLRQFIPAQYIPLVLSAYNFALTKAFTVGLAIACASILGSASLEWRSTRAGHEQQKVKAVAVKDVEDGEEKGELV